MVVVMEVGQSLDAGGAAARSSGIPGRSIARAIDAPRIENLRLRQHDRLKKDIMLPAVAKIAGAGEHVADAVDEVAQQHTLLIDHLAIVIVDIRIGDAVDARARDKVMEVVILPVEDHLEDPVQYPSDGRCAFPGPLTMSSPRCVTCKPTPAALTMVCARPLAIGADPPIPKSSQQRAGSGRGCPATALIPCRPIPAAGEQDRRAGWLAFRYRDFSANRCGTRR
jgi:hypothetical protein